jgi:drug/metabolite transporter (DMT)-like permease
VVGLLTAVPMLALETPTLSGLRGAAIPILYAGVFSCAVAYTLQIIGQQRCEPVVATVLMSLESVFALLAGAVLLGERMSQREMLGCAIMFLAIVLVQVPLPGKKKS